MSDGGIGTADTAQNHNLCEKGANAPGKTLLVAPLSAAKFSQDEMARRSRFAA